MKCELRDVVRNGKVTKDLFFRCPGCPGAGYHLLHVNNTEDKPSWDWNGSFDKPTLSPSILSRYNDEVCHSFLVDGVFEFLSDSTHKFAGMKVEMPHLEEPLN